MLENNRMNTLSGHEPGAQWPSIVFTARIHWAAKMLGTSAGRSPEQGRSRPRHAPQSSPNSAPCPVDTSLDAEGYDVTRLAL